MAGLRSLLVSFVECCTDVLHSHCGCVEDSSDIIKLDSGDRFALVVQEIASVAQSVVDLVGAVEAVGASVCLVGVFASREQPRVLQIFCARGTGGSAWTGAGLQPL